MVDMIRYGPDSSLVVEKPQSGPSPLEPDYIRKFHRFSGLWILQSTGLPRYPSKPPVRCQNVHGGIGQNLADW